MSGPSSERSGRGAGRSGEQSGAPWMDSLGLSTGFHFFVFLFD